MFHCWSLLFATGFSAVFRVTTALLLQFEENILLCDSTNFSELMNSMGSAYLRKESEVAAFYRKLSELSMVKSLRFAELEINESSLQTLRASFLEKQQSQSAATVQHLQTIDEDIQSIQNRIRSLFSYMTGLLSSIQSDIQLRQRFVSELINLQTIKTYLALDYDTIESALGHRINAKQSKLKAISGKWLSFGFLAEERRKEEEERERLELKLRSVSYELTENSRRIKEADLTIQQMVKRIDLEIAGRKKKRGKVRDRIGRLQFAACFVSESAVAALQRTIQSE